MCGRAAIGAQPQVEHEVRYVDRQHHHRGLHDAADDEGEHRGGVRYGRGGRMPGRGIQRGASQRSARWTQYEAPIGMSSSLKS
ncbi:MAG: hypothetical protein AMXMBFR52_05070 [Burkholderiales bacterium]